jgi:hypothetical protein
MCFEIKFFAINFKMAGDPLMQSVACLEKSEWWPVIADGLAG